MPERGTRHCGSGFREHDQDGSCMGRLRRKGRILKWAGLLLLLPIAVAWVVSQFYRCDFDRTVRTCRRPAVAAGHSVSVRLLSGGLWFGWNTGAYSVPRKTTWTVERYYRWQGYTQMWLPSLERGTTLVLGWSSTPLSVWHVGLPLWIPFLVIAIPTAFLWWSDRRRIPLHSCKGCGYDLTGNMSGMCPECGQNLSGTPTR